MDHNQQEQIALHRWAVIAEAAGDNLTTIAPVRPHISGQLARHVAASCPRGSDRASAMIRDRSASVIRCLRPHPGRLPSPSMPMALNWCSQRRVTLNTSDGLEHLPNSQVLAAAVRPGAGGHGADQ